MLHERVVFVYLPFQRLIFPLKFNFGLRSSTAAQDGKRQEGKASPANRLPEIQKSFGKYAEFHAYRNQSFSIFISVLEL